MSDHDRRSTDALQEQIDDLIVATNDPEKKTFLLIMNKIATNLEINTNLTRALAIDFKEHTKAFALHEEKEMALFNQRQGGSKIGFMALGIIQILVGFIVGNTLADIKDMRQELTVVQREVSIHKEHHQQEERFAREQGKNVPSVR